MDWNRERRKRWGNIGVSFQFGNFILEWKKVFDLDGVFGVVSVIVVN